MARLYRVTMKSTNDFFKSVGKENKIVAKSWRSYSVMVATWSKNKLNDSTCAFALSVSFLRH
jgi:hypothetical protein